MTALARTPRRLVDSYLDTDDWRMARAGFVLRTRRRGRHDEVTLKDTRPAEGNGLRHRLEVTEVVPDAGLAMRSGQTDQSGAGSAPSSAAAACARCSRCARAAGPSRCGWAASTRRRWRSTTP